MLCLVQVELVSIVVQIACAVPRWDEVEANGNGSIKDVDRLLRTHKTVVPERDSWCVSMLCCSFHFCVKQVPKWPNVGASISVGVGINHLGSFMGGNEIDL